MYQVICDSLLLYDDRIENLKIFSPNVDLEVNKTGSFTFSIYPDHPYYDFVKKLKSIVEVWQDDFLLFRGRVLNDEVGFYNEKYVECEGDMSFLLDSIVDPFVFEGTVQGFLSYIVQKHNERMETSKQFTVGTVTVSDDLTVDATEYLSAMEHINQNLIDRFGGFIKIRRQGGVNYIDYLSRITIESGQTVEFAKNLLDLKRIRKGEDIATMIVPLGAKQEDGTRLTIKDVNGGLDYIQDTDAVGLYGKIMTVQTWDDITLASDLLTKARSHLASLTRLPELVELTTADLSAMGQDVTAFHIGTMVQVTSNQHGINQKLLVSKLSISLLNPAENKLSLGGVIEGFANKVGNVSQQLGDVRLEIEREGKKTSEIIYNLEQNFQSSIEQTEKNITSSVLENVYLKDETDRLVSQVSTSLNQTSTSFEMQFQTIEKNLDDVINGTDAEFEEIKKYIRFENGKILLGEIGNQLELQIANDKISFLQSGTEVAYFNNHKLYVTNGHFINSLQLGEFAFIPRENGNLSFKKITTSTDGNIVGVAMVQNAIVG